MKRLTASRVIASLLAGIIITLLLTAQMSWKQLGNCVSDNPMYSQYIKQVGCSGLEYGYPYRFLYTQPSVDVSVVAPNHVLPVLLGADSTIKLDKARFAANLIIWSAASLATILFFTSGSRSKRQ